MYSPLSHSSLSFCLYFCVREPFGWSGTVNDERNQNSISMLHTIVTGSSASTSLASNVDLHGTSGAFRFFYFRRLKDCIIDAFNSIMCLFVCDYIYYSFLCLIFRFFVQTAAKNLWRSTSGIAFDAQLLTVSAFANVARSGRWHRVELTSALS